MLLRNTVNKMMEEEPVLQSLHRMDECLWINPHKKSCEAAKRQSELSLEDVLDASSRLERFAPYIRKVFPETQVSGGILESPLKEIDRMQAAMCTAKGAPREGKWLLKCDSLMPVSGSIKARGGIYEVLCHAEAIALKDGRLGIEGDYSILAEEYFRELFSNYSVAVGSTGNLGLAIGIMSAKLGFSVTVHMSSDARQWKKELLRSKGVRVMEYADDYSLAVEEGRRQAEGDLSCYFVDDENSKTLFLGYSVAALRLKRQLEEIGITVDRQHPLFVYLPCGVGGGPGGVAFGIRQVFGDSAHCFFAEPTHAPCMMLGMATGLHSEICVQDVGIDNLTAADGLAVGRPSGFVGKLMEPFLSGCYTVTDENLYRMLSLLGDTQDLWLEPSALAGMCGPLWMMEPCARQYFERNGILDYREQITHIIWGTGGSMVPVSDMQSYYKIGREL